MREVLSASGQPVVIGLLGGGNRNTVLEIPLGQRRLVARQSHRGSACLDWEIAFLDHLASHGLKVPAVMPALGGRRYVDSPLRRRAASPIGTGDEERQGAQDATQERAFTGYRPAQERAARVRPADKTTRAGRVTRDHVSV
jgi:hypothetical protein